MAAENQNFKMWVGEDKILEFEAIDVDDPTDVTAEWRVGHYSQAEPLLTKQGEVVVEGETIFVRVRLNSADTQEWRSGAYKHQLRGIDSEGNRNKWAEGTIDVRGIV